MVGKSGRGSWNEQGYLVIDGVPRLTPLSEFRSIDLVADVYGVLEELRAVCGHDSPLWQVTAIYGFLGLLGQCGEGQYSIFSQPDEENRQSPSPDYVLCKEGSDDEFTVEVTQIFTHPSRMKRIQFEIAVFGHVCTKLRSRVSGTFIMILPQRPKLSKAALDDACGEVADAMAAQYRGLKVNEFCKLPYNFALLKVSDEGEKMAYATAMADNKWGERVTSIIANRSDCDRELGRIFHEVEVKFRSCSRGERVLLLGVDTQLPVNVRDSALTLRCNYANIDRCYTAPFLTPEFQRIW